MKKILSALSLSALTALNGAALTINIEPGALANNLVQIKNTSDSDLVLTGTANAADLDLLRQMSRSISIVNMSSLTVQESALPDYMLFSTNVESFTFPVGIKTIGASAFSNTKIKEMVLPVGVTSVGNSAFAGCAELEKMSIPEGAAIGIGVFRNCSSLTDVTLPTSLSEIPQSTFEGCAKYVAVIPESVHILGASSYRGTAIKAANLTGVSNVGDYALADAPDLDEVTVGNHEIEFGKGVFFGDSGLAYLPGLDGDLPAGVMAQTSGALSATVNSEVVSEGAFANNKTIDTVKLGSNVREIQAHAFRNITTLKTVDVTALGETIPELNPQAFSGLLNDDGRYDIVLTTAKDKQQPWKDADVWNLFDITDVPSSTGSIQDVSVNIYISRHGADIELKSEAPINRVQVYSVSGMLLYEAAPNAETVSIPGVATDEIVMVKAVSNGMTKIVKLR